MATSKHLAIREAVAALFAVAAPLAGGRIHQNRKYSLAEGVPSQIHVNRRESLPTAFAIHNGPIDWATELEIVILARRAAGVEAENVADEIWTGAYARLMADQTLGGLAGQVTAGPVQFEQDQADTDVASITWSVTVDHRTSDNVIS